MDIHMLIPDLLEAAALLILPGMLIDYIIRIASSRGKSPRKCLPRPKPPKKSGNNKQYK